MAIEQFKELFPKISSSVMLILIANIFEDSFLLRIAHAECRISLLP
jgi:hypothetical protein